MESANCSENNKSKVRLIGAVKVYSTSPEHDIDGAATYYAFSRSEVECMSQIELRHLRTLVALRDTGSLVEAAERVFLTQSALSHQMKELEVRVGCSLFVRKTRPVRFTSAGGRLLKLADEVRAGSGERGGRAEQGEHPPPLMGLPFLPVSRYDRQTAHARSLRTLYSLSTLSLLTLSSLLSSPLSSLPPLQLQ